MLVVVKKLSELNFSMLMQVYRESNLHNARLLENWDGTQLLQVEQSFYDYLRYDFFPTPGVSMALWVVDGQYRAALRLEPYQDGLLLEGLETHPDHRGRGHATALVSAVTKSHSGTNIYSHVRKTNRISLAVHGKCGFGEILDYACFIDGSVSRQAVTLVWRG